MTRDAAISKAQGEFDSGGFIRSLERLVSCPTDSQDPDNAQALSDYLEEVIRPLLEGLGCACRISQIRLRAEGRS